MSLYIDKDSAMFVYIVKYLYTQTKDNAVSFYRDNDSTVSLHIDTMSCLYTKIVMSLYIDKDSTMSLHIDTVSCLYTKIVMSLYTDKDSMIFYIDKEVQCLSDIDKDSNTESLLAETETTEFPLFSLENYLPSIQFLRHLLISSGWWINFYGVGQMLQGSWRGQTTLLQMAGGPHFAGNCNLFPRNPGL